jgi:hypothetical protein
MKITDLVEKQLTEAPMGALKNIGNRAAAAFGSGKAQGRLETGQAANQLKKEFDQYLGKTGQEATGEMVLQFLKSKGIPTSGAARAIGIPDLAPEPAQPAAQPAPEQPAAQDASAQPEPAAAQPAPEQPAAQSSNTLDTDKLKPQSGPGNRKSGDIIKVGANTLQWIGTPGQEWFIASGPLSEPNPQTDRFTGVVSVGGKRFISADNAKAKLQAENKKHSKKGLFETYLRYFRILKEALTDKQLDAMFLAAAQERATQASTAQPAAQPAQSLSTGQKASAAAAGAATGVNQAMGQITGTRSSFDGGAGSAASSILDDLDVPTLKNALKSAAAGQPIQDEQQKIEISKLLKKL